MIFLALGAHLWDRLFKSNITGKYPEHERRPEIRPVKAKKPQKAVHGKGSGEKKA